MGTLAQSPRLMPAVVAFAGQTDFAANFPALPEGGPYVGLFMRRVRGGVVAILDLTAFTVQAPAEGSFTARLNAGALAGDQYQVFGMLPAERDVALTPGGAVLTEILEEDAVNLQAQLQELRRDEARAISAPLGETPALLPPVAARAGKILIFDGAGNPTLATPGTIELVIRVLAVRRAFTPDDASVEIGDQLLSIEVGEDVTCGLPDPADTPGRIISIVDGLGVAGDHPITVQASAGHIAGALSIVLQTPFASLTLISNGVTWLIFSVV